MSAVAVRIFFVFVMLVFSCTASRADSARDIARDNIKTMLAAGSIDDAIAELNSLLSSAPADAELSNLLCRAYYELEDWDRAESSCRKAVATDPEIARFHLWMGRVYGEKADRTNFLAAASLAVKVRSELERAVQLNPKDLDARLDLSEFYIEAPGIMGGGEQKARDQAQAIAQLNPAREHWVYARLAEQKKDAPAAEREYRQFIEVSNGDAEAWLNLALFLRRQARLDEMEQALLRLSRLSQTQFSKPEGRMEASELLYRTNRNYPLALEFIRRYLAAGPVEAAPAFKAHYLQGELLEKQGDKAGAAAEYRASLSLARNFGLAQRALSRVAL
jgi:tetratricopeptide (TPR) repeat protein